MPYASRVVRGVLTGKLGFTETRGQRHPTFERWHDGRVVGVTHISHGAGGNMISEQIVGMMARQLNVRAPQFRRAIDCSLSGEQFLSLLLGE